MPLEHMTSTLLGEVALPPVERRPEVHRHEPDLLLRYPLIRKDLPERLLDKREEGRVIAPDVVEEGVRDPHPLPEPVHRPFQVRKQPRVERTVPHEHHPGPLLDGADQVPHPRGDLKIRSRKVLLQ